ncbi:hypothetical protein V6N12_064926 [Hibiscus sabdariffa]|uniref:Uncharacterized protein n=1 Tax=Hibiscus sabdariffa TaxID=183260 RepID=A0ABR2G8M0_9ROSI
MVNSEVTKKSGDLVFAEFPPLGSSGDKIGVDASEEGVVLDGVVVALTGAAQSSANLGVTDAAAKTDVPTAAIGKSDWKSPFNQSLSYFPPVQHDGRVIVRPPQEVRVELFLLLWSWYGLPHVVRDALSLGTLMINVLRRLRLVVVFRGIETLVLFLVLSFSDVGQSVNVTLGDVKESDIGLGHGGQVGETSKIALLETDGSGGQDCEISNNGSARVEDSVVECVTVVGSEFGVDSSSSAMAVVESPN